MKTAFLLLILGLVIGLVIPYFLQDIVSSAQVELPQFIWPKSLPRNFDFSIPMFFRVMGLVFMALAILRFILVRGSKP